MMQNTNIDEKLEESLENISRCMAVCDNVSVEAPRYFVTDSFGAPIDSFYGDERYVPVSNMMKALYDAVGEDVDKYGEMAYLLVDIINGMPSVEINFPERKALFSVDVNS